MQVFVGKKCGGSHRAPNGIWSDGGRCTVAEHQLQHDSYCAFSIFSPNPQLNFSTSFLRVHILSLLNLLWWFELIYPSISWNNLHLRPRVESITEDNVESNCSMIEKIPPKGVSFSDLICIFAISIVGFSCLFCNTKISEFFDMAYSFTFKIL